MVTAKLIAAVLMAGAPPAPAPQQQVTVAASAARPAIMRILEADDLDVEALAPGEVAARMSEITQGAAPRDFWTAYQAHVRAWRDYAAARETVRGADALNGPSLEEAGAVVLARRRINASFDVVEEIAKRYGAWPPRVQTRL